jgi:hypothetical protein
MVENFCSLSERGYEKKSFTRAGHTLWEKKRKRQMNKIQSIDGGREPKDQKGATEETRDEKRLQKVEEKTKGDEKMRLFILTRFSIYEPNSQAYHHPLEVLFSEARMAAKFLVFEALGVAAMKAMVGGACIHWIVCTSTLLPARWLGKLQALLESTGKSFELVRLAPGEGNIWRFAANYRFGAAPYATCRLDDDDALCAEYYNLLSVHAREKPGTIVSFFRGRHASLENGVVTTHQKMVSQPWNAQGMARINGNIYAAGDHTKVVANNGREHKIIQDHSPGVYIQFLDPKFTVTKRKWRSEEPPGQKR